MHTDKFWSENAAKFEHNDFTAIRLLVNLLSSDDKNSVVLVRAGIVVVLAAGTPAKFVCLRIRARAYVSRHKPAD